MPDIQVFITIIIIINLVLSIASPFYRFSWPENVQGPHLSFTSRKDSHCPISWSLPSKCLYFHSHDCVSSSFSLNSRVPSITKPSQDIPHPSTFISTVISMKSSHSSHYVFLYFVHIFPCSSYPTIFTHCITHLSLQ